MNIAAMTARIENPRDLLPLKYKPLETYVFGNGKNSPTGLQHLCEDVPVVSEVISQFTLKRYDALHYWFTEEALDTAELDTDEPTEIIAKEMARIIQKANNLDLLEGDVPDWKRVRDNTSFLNGPALGNVTTFVNAFKQTLGRGFVHFDHDDIHSRIDQCSWSVLFKLLALDNEAKQLIEDQLCQHFNVREALAYMAADPSAEISIMTSSNDGEKLVTHRKWFWESKWLNDHLLANFPQFHTNFHTLIITNAAKRINSDDININRLYRVLAKLGRVNTKIVFIG
ncbi:hypothetical protein MZD04_gp410 [Pseudomonas phage Psa21]|uniref:Uncharacterized protein n=1 Tax=Pseudomonas phage Psa21 TaxID=2530023 RepID=A0A481W5C4_9CAUD|nr:hypothetical protein MZD04_gp410 [Pseudomonas phage Psa21]QBJ02938.1 hypothetical protein PSA21_420 [Pseudomonas phage Psa21]